jgi:hypothetical protein
MDGMPSRYRPHNRRYFTVALWAGTFLAASVFYCATAQRTVSWQDSGMFQQRVLTGDYTGGLGLALAHPLYVAMARPLVWVSREHLPFLLNCFSGIGAAVALANVAVLGWVLTGRRWIGALAAAMLATAQAMWWLATIAEVYTWSVACLSLEIILLVALVRRPRWWLAALLLGASGVGLCIHNFALLPLPVYSAVVVVLTARRKLPAWSVPVAAAAWLAGASPYVAMTASLAGGTGDWHGAIRSALTGDYGGKMLRLSDESHRLRENAALAAMSFLGLLLPAATLGWFRMAARQGRALATALAALTAVEVLFFVTYRVPDQFTFILPSLTMLAVAAPVGVAVLADRSRRWRSAVVCAALASLLWQPAAYRAAPGAARALGVRAATIERVPFRDEARYWMTPWKQDERSAALFAAAAFDEAAPDGVIVPDSTSQPPLELYGELRRPHSSVTVQTPHGPLPDYATNLARFRQALGGRKLFLVNPQPRYSSAALLDALLPPRKPYPGAALNEAAWKPRAPVASASRPR